MHLPDAEVSNCCKLVDDMINGLGRNQIRSNSQHREKIKSRTTLNAAKKLLQRADKLKIPLESYLSLAITAADLVSKNGLSINTLASTKVHQQITKEDSYFSKSRAQLRPTMHGVIPELDTGKKKSVLSSIRIVMESYHKHEDTEITPLLIALRTVLDPALLYSSEEIRKLVDHDALSFIGISRTVVRKCCEEMKRSKDITDTTEWRWWKNHVPMNERHALFVEE